MPKGFPASVAVHLTNRTARFQVGSNAALRSLLRSQFQFRIPGYRFAPRFQQGLWDGYICLYRYDSTATGLFLSEKARIEAQVPIKFIVQDARNLPQFTPAWPVKLAARLRPYQRECAEQMMAASKTGGLILNCTASGKTFIAAAYLARLQEEACFIVDELTLLDQARRQLAAGVGEGCVGVVGGGVFRPARVTVATMQTLHSWLRRGGPEGFNAWWQRQTVIILDEVHLAVNARTQTVLRQAANVKAVFGLTATLETNKAHVRMQAAALTGPVVYTYPLVQGVAEGVLSSGRAVAIKFPLSDVAVADYAEAYEHNIIRSRSRNRCIAALARAAVKAGRRVAVLVERVAHLRYLSRHLNDVQHVCLSGQSPLTDRTTTIQELEHGRLSLVLVTRIFAKGVDIPHLDGVIDATASNSRNAVVQRYGRGSRSATGKTNLWFFDIADEGQGGYAAVFRAHARARARALRQLQVPWCWVHWQKRMDADRQAVIIIKDLAEKMGVKKTLTKSAQRSRLQNHRRNTHVVRQGASAQELGGNDEVREAFEAIPK